MFVCCVVTSLTWYLMSLPDQVSMVLATCILTLAEEDN